MAVGPASPPKQAAPISPPLAPRPPPGQEQADRHRRPGGDGGEEDGDDARHPDPARPRGGEQRGGESEAGPVRGGDCPGSGERRLVKGVWFPRALARRILLDDDRAADVVQETLLVAMRRAGEPVRRAWLSGVAKNLARMRIRGDDRRKGSSGNNCCIRGALHPAQLCRSSSPTRSGVDSSSLRAGSGAARRSVQRSHLFPDEPQAARGARRPGPPGPDEIAARLDTQKRLVTAVHALDEPYRQTSVLCYFDGLEPAEIAARDGVPAATIRTRTHRALAMLREDLLKEHPRDRRRRSLALLPLALPEQSALPALSTEVSLTIRVVDTDGKPIDGVRVSAGDSDRVPGADGRVAFAGLTDPVRAQVMAPETAARRFFPAYEGPFETDGREVTVTLTEATVVSGQDAAVRVGNPFAGLPSE